MVRRPPVRSESEFLIELLQIDPKPNECHKCGATTDLVRRNFGIAKVLSVERDWSETVSRAAVSAVSITLAPVIGFGVVSWKRPDKTISYSVLRAELVLCRDCFSEAAKFWSGTKLKDTYYRHHPWAEKARGIGYGKYLSADDLAKLTPIGPKQGL
jgi:ribosomal protein S14